MGNVYRANDRTLDRNVALKVLKSDLMQDRDRVRSFALEALAASALSHPHIATIYEIGHARPLLTVESIVGDRTAHGHEVHYIATEYIDGQTLREAIDDGLPLHLRLELMAQVAAGLAKVHGAGIVHGDLKPDNILISREGYAKIVDFGLSKLVHSDDTGASVNAEFPILALTQKLESHVTPVYMSPEQVTGSAIDQRSDVFAFGCILYELLVGHEPFEEASFFETLHAILHHPHAPLPETVAPELRRVVDQCLKKNPSDRYATLGEAAKVLQQVVDQFPRETPADSYASIGEAAKDLRRWPHHVWPATSIRTRWRDIVADANSNGEVVVTHHNRAEVVVVSLDRYEQLNGRSAGNEALMALRAEFDHEMSVLRKPDAARKLRKLSDVTPAQIAGAANSVACRKRR